MELHNLKPAKGSVHKEKRIARGEGSGHGGTATRGHKGAQSRSGYSRKKGFEGGQMPLQRRVPKRGFKNFNRVEYTVFNLDKIQQLIDKYKFSELSPEILHAHKLIAKTDRVKILGRGELSSKINVSVHAVSETAKTAIESKGGQVSLI